MNTESQIKTANQTVASQSALNAPVLFTALFRLALLAAPIAIVIKRVGNNPLVCAIACAAVFGVWLSVDVWPFRPASAPKIASVKAQVAAYPANFAKAQWWSFLFCRIVLLGMMLHSKTTI